MCVLRVGERETDIEGGRERWRENTSDGFGRCRKRGCRFEAGHPRSVGNEEDMFVVDVTWSWERCPELSGRSGFRAIHGDVRLSSQHGRGHRCKARRTEEGAL